MKLCGDAVLGQVSPLIVRGSGQAVLGEELRDQLAGVDFECDWAEEGLERNESLAAGPGMPTAGDAIEHHLGVTGAGKEKPLSPVLSDRDDVRSPPALIEFGPPGQRHLIAVLPIGGSTAL